LFSQKSLRDWGITIEAEPLQIQSQIMNLPNIELARGGLAACE